MKRAIIEFIFQTIVDKQIKVRIYCRACMACEIINKFNNERYLN